jgi:hypothetical protein
VTAFERCDRRHRSAVGKASFFGRRTGSEIFWTTHWERGRKAEKGRELGGANYRPREPVVERDAGAALDAALRAFADVVEEDG